MNQKVLFKKDCTLKSIASEITNIEVTPEYKIEEDVIDGSFNVNGTYKITPSSINDEVFMYKLPFQIALSDDIKKESIDLSITDLNYIMKNETLHLEIEINLDYDKKEDSKMPIGIIEDEYNKEDEKPIQEIKEVDELTDEEYSKYKIYVVKKEDTLESISIKYNVSISTIEEYNKNLTLNENEKLILPLEIDE